MLHEYNEDWAQRQIERVREMKRIRDNKAVKNAPRVWEQGTRVRENVMPYPVDCCRS